MKIKIPRCCATCDHFTFKGRLEDDSNPCVDRYGYRPSTSKFGKCQANKIDVFVDQVCSKFSTDETLVDVVNVPSTWRVLQPLQDNLL